jgi:hypothetical protein
MASLYCLIGKKRTRLGADLRVGPGDEGVHIKPNNDLPLSRIIQWLKTLPTNEYVRGVRQYRWPPFAGNL